MPDTTETQTVRVELGNRGYEIAIVSGRLTEASGFLDLWVGQSAAAKALLVSDGNVAGTYGATVQTSLQNAGWTCDLFELPAGEQSKCLAVMSQMYDVLVEMKADRQTVLIAVGGGVVGDAAGFAAATYARGIPFVQVPTTLLAQVDSSVGGKVGINHPRGKNLIGAFHQPKGVLIDTDTLTTLPDRDYRSGLGEVVKYGVIQSAEFFEFLESNVAGLNDRKAEVLRAVVFQCCQLKADVVEEDEFETTGARAILNYGHTFAHAFEALAGYGELMHGEAVAIGMLCASRLAERLDLIDTKVTQRQVDLFDSLRLPTRLPESVSVTADAVLESMKLDKKVSQGRLRFVLPTRLGHVELFADVAEEDVRAAMADVVKL